MFLTDHHFCRDKTSQPIIRLVVKGGYSDLSHLTELKTTYITEIYMEKQYKSSITKNHKIRKIQFFLMVFP